MGSSSARCIVLGTPIEEGDKVGLIFLRRTNKNEMNSEKSHGTFVLYSTEYLTPVSLPIWGEYDDYGFIENIVEDVHSKRFMEKYNIPDWEYAKKNLHQYASDGFTLTEFGETKRIELSSCFVSQEGYDLFKIQFKNGDYGAGEKYDSVKEANRTYDVMLDKFTFKKNVLNLYNERESKGLSKSKMLDEARFCYTSSVYENDFFRYFGINQGTAYEITKLFEKKDYFIPELKEKLIEFYSFHHNMDYTSKMFITLPADLGGDYDFELAIAQTTLAKLERIKEEKESW